MKGCRQACIAEKKQLLTPLDTFQPPTPVHADIDAKGQAAAGHQHCSGHWLQHGTSTAGAQAPDAEVLCWAVLCLEPLNASLVNTPETHTTSYAAGNVTHNDSALPKRYAMLCYAGTCYSMPTHGVASMQDMLQHPSWPAVLTNDTHTHTQPLCTHADPNAANCCHSKQHSNTGNFTQHGVLIKVTMTETTTPRSNTFRCHCCELPNHSLGIL